ncbi:TraR/DksA family transcriptional regulator [Pseudomonadota bacterium]
MIDSNTITIDKLKKRLTEEKLTLFKEQDEFFAQHTVRQKDVMGSTHDRGDEALADAITEANMVHTERYKLRLIQLDRAMGRIETGTYGICLDCELPINPARLNSDPAVPLCIDCQTAKEDNRDQRDATPSL